jgi:predicted nucleotidyltransferase
MKSFQQVISEAASGGGVNLLFEHGMYSLMDDLHRIVTILRDAKVPFAVVGGVAVNAYVLAVRRSRSFVTRDIDLLVDRSDLEDIIAVAQTAGYTGRGTAGGFMLIRPEQDPAEAVHLLFAGERPRSTHPIPNPPIHAEEKDLPEFGISVPVASLRDLIQMKLNSFRPKDETHLETLDRCGLITSEIESSLPPVLADRLAQARARFASEDEI